MTHRNTSDFDFCSCILSIPSMLLYIAGVVLFVSCVCYACLVVLDVLRVPTE